MVSKARVISRSGKDVTGTSAASSERRGTGGSSSSDSSVSPAARKGYSRSKKRDDKPKKEDDKSRIKSTAERQKEAREKAGGGKDYSDIPEGTAVSKERQAKATRESYERGMKEYEKRKDPVKRAVLESVEEGRRFRDPQTRRERPDRFDIESGETPRGAGRQTRTDVQREEQARREQQTRAQEAMTLPRTQEPTLDVQRGPALTVARSKGAQPEQVAQAYERGVESRLAPLTGSRYAAGRFVGGAAETVAYAPTALPRLAFGLARDPEAVGKETVQSQVETIRTDPARGLGQVSAMLVGPKAARGVSRTAPRITPSGIRQFPGKAAAEFKAIRREPSRLRFAVTENLPGARSRRNALDTELAKRYDRPTKVRTRRRPSQPIQFDKVSKVEPGNVDVITGFQKQVGGGIEPTYRGTAPQGKTVQYNVGRTVGTSGQRGIVRGGAEATGKGPIEISYLTGTDTPKVQVPNIRGGESTITVLQKPQQLSGLRVRRTRQYDTRSFDPVEMQQMPKQPVEAFGFPEKRLVAEFEPTGGFQKRTVDPTTTVFERPGVTKVTERVEQPTIFKQTPYRKRTIKTPSGRTRQRGLKREFKEPEIGEPFPKFPAQDRTFRSFLRSEEAQLGKVEVRPQTTQRPVFGETFRAATRRRGAVFERPTIKPRSEMRMGAIGTGALATSMAMGARSASVSKQQPLSIQIPTYIPRISQVQTPLQIQKSVTPQAQKTTQITPALTTAGTGIRRPARGISTPRPPRMPEIRVPKIGRRRKETGKKKDRRRKGVGFYDVENPLAGFEQVFKGFGGRKK